jgi:hypothetical protein
MPPSGVVKSSLFVLQHWEAVSAGVVKQFEETGIGYHKLGRGITQVGSHWLPTAAARVGFVVDKVALGQVFSKYFGFPCQIAFHRLLHNHHHLSPGAGKIGQIVAAVPSGLTISLTPWEKWITLSWFRITIGIQMKRLSSNDRELDVD